MILDPRGLTVVEWTDYVNLDLGVFGVVGRLDDESRWREWGSSVCAFPGVASQFPPNPYDFPDWLEWAFRFNQAVSTPS